MDDARKALKTVKAALAKLAAANGKATTEPVQEILCELTEACDLAIADLAAVIIEECEG